MDRAEFERQSIKEAGRIEGRTEGHAIGLMEGRAEERTAERAREAALLEAMSEQGCSLKDATAAFTNGNLDELYREYGIE